MPRRLVAELYGTFFLTLAGAGAEVVGAVSGKLDPVEKALAPGLVVMALIYAMGEVSGAHFNPVVTLAFALRGVFRWSRVPAYLGAQAVGAIAAAGLIRAVFGQVRDVGITRLEYVSSTGGLLLEALLTFLLATVILNTAHRHRVVGNDAALAVGATIALAGFAFGPVTGASMNPTRSFGPALVSGRFSDLWVYLLGPVIGAVAAVLLTTVLHPHRDREEETTAEGDLSQQ